MRNLKCISENHKHFFRCLSIFFIKFDKNAVDSCNLPLYNVTIISIATALQNKGISFILGALFCEKRRAVDDMKKTHSIKTKIVLLAVVPMLLIAFILLGYALIGGTVNITTALKDSMSETAKISAQAITNQLVIYETAVNEAAANVLFQTVHCRSCSVLPLSVTEAFAE